MEIVKLAGIYSKPNKDEVVFSFVCKITGGTIILNDEAKDIQYFALDDIPKNTVPKQVERIHDFFSPNKEMVMKIQTGKGCIELIKE